MSLIGSHRCVGDLNSLCLLLALILSPPAGEAGDIDPVQVGYQDQNLRYHPGEYQPPPVVDTPVPLVPDNSTPQSPDTQSEPERRRHEAARLNNEGVELENNGRRDAARESYRRALEQTPGDSTIMRNLENCEEMLRRERAYLTWIDADAMAARGDLEGAINLYDTALGFHPNHPGILQDRAKAEALLEQKRDEERKRLQREDQRLKDLADALANAPKVLGKGVGPVRGRRGTLPPSASGLSLDDDGDTLFSKGTKDSAPVVMGPLSFDDVAPPIAVPRDLRDAPGPQSEPDKLTKFPNGNVPQNIAPVDRRQPTIVDKPQEELPSIVQHSKKAPEAPDDENAKGGGGKGFDESGEKGKAEVADVVIGDAGPVAPDVQIEALTWKIKELEAEGRKEDYVRISELKGERSRLEYEKLMQDMGVVPKPVPKKKADVPSPVISPARTVAPSQPGGKTPDPRDEKKPEELPKKPGESKTKPPEEKVGVKIRSLDEVLDAYTNQPALGPKATPKTEQK